MTERPQPRPSARLAMKGGLGLGGLVLVATLATGCAGHPTFHSSMKPLTGNAPWTTTAGARSNPSTATKTVDVTIENVKTPDGPEPAYVGPAQGTVTPWRTTGPRVGLSSDRTSTPAGGTVSST